MRRHAIESARVIIPRSHLAAKTLRLEVARRDASLINCFFASLPSRPPLSTDLLANDDAGNACEVLSLLHDTSSAKNFLSLVLLVRVCIREKVNGSKLYFSLR